MPNNGKICYIEIPASDVQRSSEFYEKCFGWKLRRRGDGAIAFDDAVGGVSGTWVSGRPPMKEPGLMVYIFCDRVEATIKSVMANGGGLVRPHGAAAPGVTVPFSDPA